MLAALLVGLSLVSSTMLLGKFRGLDEERSRSELHRVLGDTGERLASLRAVGMDWAFWDDTYRFAVGEQPDYEAQNLTDEALATLSLSLFAVIDAGGRFVLATGFDPENKTRVPLPAGIDSVLRALPAFPPQARSESIQAGILPLPGGMLLLARVPILTSRFEGPGHGALVLGRWFVPSDMVSGADSANGLKISLAPLTESMAVAGSWDMPLPSHSTHSADPDSDSGTARFALRSLAERVERDDDRGRVAGEAVVRGFLDIELLIFRADLPGKMAAEGRHAVRMLIGAFLVIGCLFGLMILLLLERNVLSRVGRLHREVTGIAANGDFCSGVTAIGRDEISGLAASINDLLRTLDASLRGKEGMLRDLGRAKAEAEETLRAKSRFLSTMSHEIRTPMGAVLGMAGLLLDTELTDEQREHVLILQGGAENLLHILDDILDLSKIEEGKMVLDQDPYDPREPVEDVAGLLAWNAAKKGIEITAAVDPTLPSQVRGDPARVRQILTNLVGNAVKFTSKGEIAVEVVATKADGCGPVLCFAVRDTGIGIASDRLSAIFDEFTQEDQSTTRRFGGTGLGLAISRRLATLMGGSLTAESVPGSGSTFRLTVPLWPVESVLPEELPPDGRRVLLVDDSAWSRAAVTALLRSRGHVVREASSASEALAILASGGAGFDACLVDRRLPDRDGLELAGEIQHRPGATGRVPVILLCGPGEAPRDVDATLLGVAGIIAKPVRRSRLLAELRRLGMESETRPEVHGGPGASAAESTTLGNGPTFVPTPGEAAAIANSTPASSPPASGLPVPVSIAAAARKTPAIDSIGATARRTPAIDSIGATAGRTPVIDSIAVSAQGLPATTDPVPPPPGFRVLVVDDNAVNRRVVRRMIEKAGGHVDEADGGEVAVRLCREHPFGLVLMDVQMPGMDGYQATAAIRADDALRGTHTPILALTANALPQDRALCLASGMDEHLGKPVRSPDLIRALAKWTKRTKEEPTMERIGSPETPQSLQPLQLDRLDEISGGDSEFEKELLGEFLRTAPILVEDVAKAIAAGDAAAAQRAAHTLKGSSGSIGAGLLAEASRFLEETCKQGRFEEAAPRVDQIRTRLDDLAAFVLDHYGDMAA
jgi:signal transduction histidine kinase/CheY-like chemotaxis protein/HPt (histidine-containing phosphotransfer) domain-containing protein